MHLLMDASTAQQMSDCYHKILIVFHNSINRILAKKTTKVLWLKSAICGTAPYIPAFTAILALLSRTYLTPDRRAKRKIFNVVLSVIDYKR